MLRMVFFGTPKEAAGILRGLIDAKCEIAAVITQPDRRRGRGLILENSPVKELALRSHLPVLQPEDLKTDAFLEAFSQSKADIGVVAAYGMIIPKAVLAIPKHGFINIHASLLPAFRGAAPIQWALINGEDETGVTIFKLSETLDAGDVIVQKSIKISDDDNAGTLSEKLFKAGGETLLQVLNDIENGLAVFTAQNDSLATYAPKIEKEIGAIDWRADAKRISCLVRALSPSPGAYTFYKGKLLKIFAADERVAGSGVHIGEPGTIVESAKNIGFIISTGKGPILIQEVQPQSGKRMSAWEFFIGHRLNIGDILPS